MQLKTNALPNKTSGWSYYNFHAKLNCNFWDSNHRFLISHVVHHEQLRTDVLWILYVLVRFEATGELDLKQIPIP